MAKRRNRFILVRKPDGTECYAFWRIQRMTWCVRSRPLPECRMSISEARRALRSLPPFMAKDVRVLSLEEATIRSVLNE